MTKNTACQEREYLTVKYSDLIEERKKPKDERTGDEIVDDIRAKMAALREGGEAT